MLATYLDFLLLGHQENLAALLVLWGWVLSRFIAGSTMLGSSIKNGHSAMTDRITQTMANGNFFPSGVILLRRQEGLTVVLISRVYEFPNRMKEKN